MKGLGKPEELSRAELCRRYTAQYKTIGEQEMEIQQLKHIRDKQRQTITALSSNDSAFSKEVGKGLKRARTIQHYRKAIHRYEKRCANLTSRVEDLTHRLNTLDAHERARDNTLKAANRLRKDFAASDDEIIAYYVNEAARQISKVERVTATLGGKLETVAKRLHGVMEEMACWDSPPEDETPLLDEVARNRDYMSGQIEESARHLKADFTNFDNAAIVRFHKIEARMDKAEAAITWGTTNDG